MERFLNEQFQLRDAGLSNGVDGAQLPRHRWYTFKEAFSPRLIAKAIDDSGIKQEALVFDPFCGSGTTPIAASARGRRGLGVEVNPFLAFVSRTKLTRLQPHRLDSPAQDALAGARRGTPSPLESFSTFSRRGGASKWLFNESILRAFEGGWKASSTTPAAARNLIRLALLGAAMDTCNAVRDGKCLRYRRDWQEVAFGRREFLAAFETRLGDIRTDLGHELESPKSACSIQIGDSRRRTDWCRQDLFSLCVTSPPYLNSFDYSDVYRPELFLGKFVGTNEELRALRLRTLRSHVQVDWAQPALSDFGPLYRRCVEQLQAQKDLLWSSKLPLMIQAYFEDMYYVLGQLRKLAQARAPLWVVVSTSAYAGVEVPVDLIIADIGGRVGWRLREVGVLRYLRTAGQHWNRWSGSEDEKPRLRESVIIFERAGSK